VAEAERPIRKRSGSNLPLGSFLRSLISLQASGWYRKRGDALERLLKPSVQHVRRSRD